MSMKQNDLIQTGNSKITLVGSNMYVPPNAPLPSRGGQDSSPEDIDNTLLKVHHHLMVKDELRSPKGGCVLRHLRPLVVFNVIHVEVTLRRKQALCSYNGMLFTMLNT